MADPDFDRFYGETAGGLHAYVSRMSGSPVLADDIVQDAYVRFLRASSTPDEERAARAYLFRIARNLFRDHLRREDARERRRGRAVEDGWPAAGSPDPSPGCGIDVHRALRELRPRDREVLWLAHVVEMSHREIAEVIGVAEGSVKVLALRARRRFRSVLEERGMTEEKIR